MTARNRAMAGRLECTTVRIETRESRENMKNGGILKLRMSARGKYITAKIRPAMAPAECRSTT